jgi:DNA ligase-1
MHDLQFLMKITRELGATNSSNEKKVILKDLHDREPDLFNKLISYTYDYDKRFFVTKKNYLKIRNDIQRYPSPKDLFEVLDKLRTREVTGHAALGMIKTYADSISEEELDAFFKILDKDLGVAVGTSLINDVLPNTCKEFEVALATTFDKVQGKKGFKLEDYWVGRKLDGVRCIIDTNNMTATSRQGKEFQTLGVILDELKSLNIQGYILDGEVCLIDSNGNEDYQGIMKEITNKDYTVPNPKYILFDILTPEEFDNKYSSVPYIERMNRMAINNNKHIQPWEFSDASSSFDLMQDKAKENNWEGLMLRSKTIYEGKRAKSLVKVKEMEDSEFEVTGIIEGEMPVLTDGIMVKTPILAAISILEPSTGMQCDCGSGFTIEQRRAFLADPKLILGKTVTVQYFERTKDQTGKPSLRFPVFKGIREII